ncbi:MAG: CcmD family protein [Chloroflexota bacterium]
MGFLAASFIVVWGLVTVYVIYMGFHQRRLEQELETLKSLAEESKQTGK